MRSRRVGRYTASILLVSVGILLFLDWRNGTDNMLFLLKWWPIIAVFWGMEYLLIYFSARRHGQGRKRSRSRMDLRGLLSAVALAACVFMVSEQEHYLHLWNKVSLNLTAAAVDYGEAKGSKFQKAPFVIPVELSTSKITVDGINGDILIHRAPVEDIEIGATVWVDQLEGAVAEAISEQSFVEVTEGSNIKITPKGKAYGDSGKRQPRMDLDISLPEDRRFNLEVRTMNGGITLQNVEAIENINLETGNGELILHRIFGNVKGKTLNGAVRARTVQGTVDLATSGGDMAAWDVMGSLKLSTAVGNISAMGSRDEVDLSSKNGNMEINGARSKLHAESLNGKIDVRSSDLGGNWDIYSAVGDIDLYLPMSGNYTMDGSSGYGDIISNIPELTIDKKNISGEVGTGEFKLHVEGNSNLNVRKY
ncbi:protein liaG [Paenibacillus sp. P32E]|nr:protein liaG [Paenibacillus sp. P32E]